MNRKLQNTLLAMISGNTRLVGKEATQFLIDPATTEGASAGVSNASAPTLVLPQGNGIRATHCFSKK